MQKANVAIYERPKETPDFDPDVVSHALVNCEDLWELKNYRDGSITLEEGAARRSRKNSENTRCRIRLERKIGQVLLNTERAKARGSNQHEEVSYRATAPTEEVSYRTTAPTLDQLRISRDQSSLWQHLAEVPEEMFEKYLCGDTNRISASGCVRQYQAYLDKAAARKKNAETELEKTDPEDRGLRHLDGSPMSKANGETTAMDDDALHIWETLTDLQDSNILFRNPAELVPEMTISMHTKLKPIIPPVIKWLSDLQLALRNWGETDHG